MGNQIIVQYVGFQVKALVREYLFAVREVMSEPIQYTLTIANEAFASRRVGFQDGPSVCSRRLHHELAANANHPPTTQFRVTDAELADYQDLHRPKSGRSLAARRKE